MPANDEFPRGLLQNVQGTPGPPGIALPAITYPGVGGIAWVLTEIDLKVQFNTAGNWLVVGTNPAGGPRLLLGAGSLAVDEASWNGEFIVPAGSGLTIGPIIASGNQCNIYSMNTNAYPI